MYVYSFEIGPSIKHFMRFAYSFYSYYFLVFMNVGVHSFYRGWAFI